MEGEREQPFLILDERTPGSDIQKSLRIAAVAVLGQERDLAGWLDEEEGLGTVRCFFHQRRAVDFQTGKGSFRAMDGNAAATSLWPSLAANAANSMSFKPARNQRF